MGNRLKQYITRMEGKLQTPLTAEEREKLKEDLLVQIGFFQHERLIHLIVTVTFAVLTLMTVLALLSTGQLPLLALLILFLALLIPYIAHYYKLENGVQRLYRCYDTLADSAPAQTK